ncbi:restriction endonuclease subunit S [Helicobacter pylori]
MRLGDICEIVKGQQINKISLNNTDKYPVINGGIDFLGYTNKFNVSKNTIAISEGGTCGYVRFMKSDFWSGGHNYSLQKISNKVNNLCLYHILKSYEKDIMKLGVGSGLKNIQLKALKDFEIPLPPLNEQSAIANILSDVDHYLYSLDALILKKESVKKALSFELLSQRKRLKSFNQNWQRVRLGDILELLTDYHANGSYELLKNNVTLLKHVDFAIMIRTTNFENNDFKNDLIYINKKAYEFLSKSKVFAGDILVNKIANAGTAYFMPKLNQPVSLGMNLFLLRIKPNYNNFFIFKQIANYERVLKTFANGSATKTITKNVIKNLLIPLPPLDEQIAIANILSALDHEIISLKNKKRQFENIKKALNHDLMSAKIRVLKK